MLTADQIQTELDAIREQILSLTAQSTSSYASQGRQVVMESARNKLTVLYAREAYLMSQLARIESGGTAGIRVRWGVPVR